MTVYSGLQGTLHISVGFGASSEGYYVTSAQEALGRGIKSRPDDIPNTAKLSFLLGKYLQQEYHGVFYSKCQNLARELRKAYDDALKKYDVVIMPTIPLKAPKIPSADVSLEGELVVKVGSYR